MEITITLEQFDKIRRLSDFGDYWLENTKPDSDFYLKQWQSDREDVLLAQEVLKGIELLILDGDHVHQSEEE